MSLVVGIHGIAQEFKGPNALKAAWLPALRDGLHNSHSSVSLNEEDLSTAFWGDLFRRGPTMGLGEPRLEAADVEDGWESEFLQLLWAEAATIDPGAPRPNDRTMGAGTRLAQRAALALVRSRFFSRLGEAYFVLRVKQVTRT